MISIGDVSLVSLDILGIKSIYHQLGVTGINQHLLSEFQRSLYH